VAEPNPFDALVEAEYRPAAGGSSAIATDTNSSTSTNTAINTATNATSSAPSEYVIEGDAAAVAADRASFDLYTSFSRTVLFLAANTP
jgi:hypothetical protein